MRLVRLPQDAQQSAPIRIAVFANHLQDGAEKVLYQRYALVTPPRRQKAKCAWIDEYPQVANDIDIDEVQCRLGAIEVVMLGDAHWLLSPSSYQVSRAHSPDQRWSAFLNTTRSSQSRIRSPGATVEFGSTPPKACAFPSLLLNGNTCVGALRIRSRSSTRCLLSSQESQPQWVGADPEKFKRA